MSQRFTIYSFCSYLAKLLLNLTKLRKKSDSLELLSVLRYASSELSLLIRRRHQAGCPIYRQLNAELPSSALILFLIEKSLECIKFTQISKCHKLEFFRVVVPSHGITAVGIHRHLGAKVKQCGKESGWIRKRSARGRRKEG